MIDDIRLHDKLKDDIGEKRYLHSLNVMEVARKLASHYGCDKDKAQIAGLLHDCGKYPDISQILKQADKFGIILKGVTKYVKDLVHGELGARIAKEYYGVEDVEILDAIKYHTTGRSDMTLLDKIIYLADYIEPNRSFKGVDEVRDLAYIDLDKALIKAMDNTINYVISRGYLIHNDTTNARNSLIVCKGKY